MTTEDQGPGSEWWKRREVELFIDVRSTLSRTISYAALRKAAPAEFEACSRASGPAGKERKALQKKGVPFEDWDGPAIRAEQETLRKLWAVGDSASGKAIRRFQKWLSTDDGRAALRDLCELQRKVYDGIKGAQAELDKAIGEAARPIVGAGDIDGEILHLAAEAERGYAFATGRIMRQLGQDVPTTWTHEAIKALTLTDPNEPKRDRRWIVRLVGGTAFQPELPTFNGYDPDEGTLIAALQHELPQWHTLKIIDACHSLALDDPAKDGGFWYHPARLMDLMGLRGREEGGKRYTTTAAKKRFQKRLDSLMRLQVEVSAVTITHRPGKGNRKSVRTYGKMHLLSIDRAAGTKRITLHSSERGRPATAVRMKVAALTWKEARHHIRLTGTARKFYALQDGAAYKLARYLLIRSRWLDSLELTESLENVAHHAGVEESEIRDALPYLKPLGIAARLDKAELLTAKIPAGAVDLRRPQLTRGKRDAP